MCSGWLDDIWDDSPQSNEGLTGSFYCPYTNAAECAVLTKGWQPQELCNDLECEQLNLIHRKPRGRKKAA